MFEVLAAMTVLSFGLLAVANLQVQSLRSVHAAAQRVVAVNKAAEIVDRMRANPVGVLDNTGTTSYEYPAGSSGIDHGCAATPSGPATPCNPQQIAADDYYRWAGSLDTAFPNMEPSGAISVTTATTPPTVTVTVGWSERGEVRTYRTVQQL